MFLREAQEEWDFHEHQRDNRKNRPIALKKQHVKAYVAAPEQGTGHADCNGGQDHVDCHDPVHGFLLQAGVDAQICDRQNDRIQDEYFCFRREFCHGLERDFIIHVAAAAATGLRAAIAAIVAATVGTATTSAAAITAAAVVATATTAAFTTAIQHG